MSWAAVGEMGRNQPVTQCKVQKYSFGLSDVTGMQKCKGVKGWSGMQLLSEPKETVEVTRKVYLVMKRTIHIGVALKKVTSCLF
jgi:hypothetical protein